MDEAKGRLASTEDRERALELLRRSGGRLGLEELEDRLDAAIRARTVAQLATLVWDLDGPAEDQPAPRACRSIGFRLDAAAYALTNSLLVGTWALTGHGFFWPFFPAAGWGVALGIHAVAVRAVQERKSQATARRARSRSVRAALGAVPASRPHKAPHNSPVVAMFVDVVDSTRLTEVIGDQEWARLRARCRELLRDCYGAHGGTEVSAQGDGFLARFLSPGGAVRCAVDIQRRLLAQREESGFALTVRIGVHAGEAVEETGDLLGSVINMASRVTSEAEPAEVLITEAVADHLDGRFELEDRGLRTLKGLSRPRHLVSVPWAD